MNEYNLTPREQRFADEYIANGRNATQAYKLISPNAKATTCATKGLEMVRRKHVADYIKDKTRERLDASNLTAQDVIDELISIGFAKMQKSVSKQKDLLNDEVISHVEFEGTAKYEDRLKALELLGKNLVLFTDKQELTGNVGVTIVDDLDDE